MIYEDFRKWKFENNYSMIRDEEHDQTIFSRFYDASTVGKQSRAVLTDLAWQIYQLQCCVEGLLEDI